MAVTGCKTNSEIERVQASDLSPSQFQERYFSLAKPIVITGATADWPCRQWTIESLMQTVGDNEVLIRGKTSSEDYKVGKAHTIRRDLFRNYCQDLLDGNSRARNSYLAVASIQQVFPQLLDGVPLPEYLTVNGKLHLGPYLWVAFKGHYEFLHFDPDDNFLVMIQGRKQLRLFSHEYIDRLYPNPLGSHGKTIQSQVNLDNPDLSKFPNFAHTECHHTVLHPGDMLFIPAFYWHQVSALDSGISCNMFYGDRENGTYVGKLLRPPFRPHFEHWLLNIVEQNRPCESFPKMLERLPEVLFQFFVKQFHDEVTEEQLDELVEILKKHFGLDELPLMIKDAKQSKFPPRLKIRGLLHRNGKT